MYGNGFKFNLKCNSRSASCQKNANQTECVLSDKCSPCWNLVYDRNNEYLKVYKAAGRKKCAQ